MTSLPSFVLAEPKDPGEVLDYLVDFSDQLALDGGDTLDTAAVVVEAGITKDSQAVSSSGVTVWLSGGTHLTDYDVTVTADTVAGRTYVQTLRVPVRRK